MLEATCCGGSEKTRVERNNQYLVAFSLERLLSAHQLLFPFFGNAKRCCVSAMSFLCS